MKIRLHDGKDKLRSGERTGEKEDCEPFAALRAYVPPLTEREPRDA